MVFDTIQMKLIKKDNSLQQCTYKFVLKHFVTEKYEEIVDIMNEAILVLKERFEVIYRIYEKNQYYHVEVVINGKEDDFNGDYLKIFSYCLFKRINVSYTFRIAE